METILVVGSTGNIGTSAVCAALRAKRQVLAIVRSQSSADKLVKNVGTDKSIFFAIADVASNTVIKSVVDQVRAGTLPAFQHVWSSGRSVKYLDTQLPDITDEQLEYNLELSFKANFHLYRETTGYLLEQKNPLSTWTICTCSQGELGLFPVPAVTQGALFSMCIAAARINEKTNVRFNHIFLGFRVEIDESAKKHGVTSATDFGQVYEAALNNREIRSSRILVEAVEDTKKLRYAELF